MAALKAGNTRMLISPTTTTSDARAELAASKDA